MVRLITILFFTLAFASSGIADDAINLRRAGSPPPVQTPAADQQLKSIVENSDTKLPEPKAPEIQPPPVFDKTMMFNEDVLKEYESIYATYVEKQKAKISKTAVDDKIGDIAGKLITDDKPKDSPGGIYLNSILYRTDIEGVAWINDIKYKVNAISNDIKLTALNQNNATITWKTAGYDVDLKAWAQIFPAISEANPDLSKLPPNRQNIRVDTNAKAIVFTLHPNQHLDIGGMAIKEGKPVAVPKAVDKPDPTLGDKFAAGGKSTIKNVKDLVDKAKEAVQDEEPKAPADKPVPLVDPNADKTASFHLSIDGHFNVPAKLNDRSINFKVDTGATVTAISSEDAVKLGIDVTKLDYKYDVKLADGSTVKAAETNIENFSIEPIKLQNINILVAQGSMAQPLLGMSFFSKLKKFTIEGDTLTLYQ